MVFKPQPSCCHRYIFLPVFLFLGCIGLSLLAEQGRASEEALLRRIVQDDDLALSIELEQAVFGISGFPESSEGTRAFYEKIKNADEKAGRLSDNLVGQQREHGFEPEVFERLRDVRAGLANIKLLVEREKVTEVGDYTDVHGALENVRRFSAEIVRLILKEHEKEREAIDRKFESATFLRQVLVSFFFMAGLVLVFVTLKIFRQYKEFERKAITAEHTNIMFSSALQSTRIGVLIRDTRKPGSPVVFVNRSFTDMTGYDLDDIQESNGEQLFGWKTDPSSMLAFRKATAQHKAATLNILIYRKDGSPFWSEWHLSPVLNEHGDVIHFVNLFTDTTVFRQTQEDLVQAKNLAEKASAIKSNFLAMMSHEIRTPINGIQGVLKLMDETPLDQEQKRFLRIAMTSSQALHRIINDILDYAKMEAGKIEIVSEPFSLNNIFEEIEGISRPLLADKPIELSFEVAPELPACFSGDAGRIGQILLNLVGNAIKFTNDGFVRARAFALMEQSVDAQPGLLVRFEVQDTGRGIASEDQGLLFKEFTQIEAAHLRQQGGTGLGLAICKRLVTMMGGEIGVESQSGKGSRFWFMVPLVVLHEKRLQQGENDKRTALSSAKRDFKDCLVLLAEDNDVNRLVARRYLEKAGLKVEEAVDGAQALAKAKQKKYDLILMDVSMPIMDGLQSTAEIRACGGYNAHVPIIALTAHVMQGDREACIKAGMNDHLTKPIDYNLLLETLQHWLHAVASRKMEIEKPCPMPENNSVSAIPDLDSKLLERLRADLGSVAAKQIINTFLNDSPIRIEGLDSADLKVVQITAHTLKSSSANCGLLRFSDAMVEMEKLAGKGLREQLEQMRGPAKALYKTSIERLTAYRQTFVD